MDDDSPSAEGKLKSKARYAEPLPAEVEKFRLMVAKLAWNAWRLLPNHHQVWIGVEDMIEDGILHAYRLYMHGKYGNEYAYVGRGHDPSKASFSTYLFHGMRDFFDNNYIRKFGFHSQKRGGRKDPETGRMVQIQVNSMQGMVEDLRDKFGGDATLDDVAAQIAELRVTPESIEQNAITECVVIPSLVAVYNEASRHTQQEMVRWFLHREIRFRSGSERFLVAASEFRTLCQCHQVGRIDCQHLMQSEQCLDTLSRQLLWIPYDLDNPTPKVDKVL